MKQKVKMTNGLNLRALREDRADREKKRRLRREERKKRSLQEGEGLIVWSKLDGTVKPYISFTPTLGLRKKVLAVLDSEDSRARQKVLVRLGKEFARVYNIYRLMEQDSRGVKRSFVYNERFMLKYAVEAGEHCFRLEVTPRQVLEYWHDNIQCFMDGRLKVPPLRFLRYKTNIQAVAKHLTGDSVHPERPKISRREVKDALRGFSDTSQLDRNLRKSLENAGFRTQKYNDSYLLTIQRTAEAVAQGADLFVSGRMRPMVDWAAKNLYS